MIGVLIEQNGWIETTASLTSWNLAFVLIEQNGWIETCDNSFLNCVDFSF